MMLAVSISALVPRLHAGALGDSSPHHRRQLHLLLAVLPANLVPTGLELFWYGDQTVNGDATPLTLARFPNRDYDTRNWTHVTKVGGPANMTIEVEADMATRLQGWVTQFNADPTSVYSHYQNPIGWADFHSEVTAVFPANGSITLGVCAGSGYSDLEVGGYLYVYNLLAEIDEPGEYSIDRTTGTVYVWPPNPAYFETSEWGLPVMGAEQVRHDHAGSAWLAGSSGAVSSGDSVIGAVSTLYDLLRFVNTQYLSFEGITFTFGRGVGLNFMGSSDITITDCVIENVGIMAVNVTGGSNVIIDSSSVRHAGNGGVFLYAGDRPTLTSSGHTISNSSLSYSNRYMYCYTPVVALGDCGNSIVGSEVYGGPHQGVFMSGNNHGLLTSYVHDVVQVVRDSGAFYTGRDWTYQGSRIENNTFARINTKLTGDDTSAVYLDDSASGYIITGACAAACVGVYLGRDCASCAEDIQQLWPLCSFSPPASDFPSPPSIPRRQHLHQLLPRPPAGWRPVEYLRQQHRERQRRHRCSHSRR